MAAKQKGNMFGGFANAAQQRKEQQEQIEAAVTGKPAPVAPAVPDDKTTITLSIGKKDKLDFKMWAVAHGTTMSDMLHEWIEKTCRGGDG